MYFFKFLCPILSVHAASSNRRYSVKRMNCERKFLRSTYGSMELAETVALAFNHQVNLMLGAFEGKTPKAGLGSCKACRV